jgi:hypothetical protein
MDEAVWIERTLLVSVVLLPFAVAGAMTIWLRGSLFASWRSRLEAGDGPLSRLLLCPLCLSVHVAFWLFVVSVAGPSLLGWWGIIAVGWLSPVLASSFLGYVVYRWSADTEVGAHREDGDDD